MADAHTDNLLWMHKNDSGLLFNWIFPYHKYICEWTNYTKLNGHKLKANGKTHFISLLDIITYDGGEDFFSVSEWKWSRQMEAKCQGFIAIMTTVNQFFYPAIDSTLSLFWIDSKKSFAIKLRKNLIGWKSSRLFRRISFFDVPKNVHWVIGIATLPMRGPVSGENCGCEWKCIVRLKCINWNSWKMFALAMTLTNILHSARQHRVVLFFVWFITCCY